MEIRSLTWLLTTPLAIIGGIICYVYYGDNEFYYIMVPVVLIIALHTAKEEVDYWWIKKYPLKLDKNVQHIVDQDSFYQTLNQDQRITYCTRLCEYLYVRDFKLITEKKQIPIPEDMKALISMECIKLTLGSEDYLLGNFDRIYFYNHSFPSPNMPYLHNLEVEKEDQMVLLNLPMSIVGIMKPMANFNIALQGFIEAFCFINSHKININIKLLNWNAPVTILGVNEEQFLSISGYKVADILALHMHCYIKDKVAYAFLCLENAKEFNRLLRF